MSTNFIYFHLLLILSNINNKLPFYTPYFICISFYSILWRLWRYEGSVLLGNIFH